MTAFFNLLRDQTGGVAYAPAFSDFNYSTTLAASTAQSFTTPLRYQNWVVVFSFDPGLRIFVSRNVTATIPTTSVAATPCVLNPTARQLINVQTGDYISVITPDDAAYVNISYYAIQ